jgi:anti-sigma B factor antagonist
MLTIITKEIDGLRCLELEGRIDSLTSADIEKKIKELADLDERIIITDLRKISYISSSGLRIFLMAQKLLNGAGGELIILKPNDLIRNIFVSSGFNRIIKIIDSIDDLVDISVNKIYKEELHKFNYNHIDFIYKNQSNENGILIPIGYPEKLISSSYTSRDIVNINPYDANFGLGLAGLGNTYVEYKEFIGETIIINNNIFVLPASKKPIVDYIFFDKNPITKYSFLYGLIVKGSFNIIGSFTTEKSNISLEDLIDGVINLSPSNILGIVFISESKGILALNIKKPPIIENAPPNIDITSEDNFSKWFDFPIEPLDYNCLVISFGIILRNLENKKNINKFFPSGLNYHFHSLVYDHILINYNINEFHRELERLSREHHPKSVIHLLGTSKFKKGLFGIINLGVD